MKNIQFDILVHQIIMKQILRFNASSSFCFRFASAQLTLFIKANPTKKRSILLLISLIAVFSAQAQNLMNSTLGAGGTTKYINGHYYSHVIGQTSVQGTFVQNGMTVRQGFKQPLINTKFKTNPMANLNSLPKDESMILFKAFPNPFLDKLTITFSSISTLSTELYLYDTQGNVLFEKVYPPLTNEIQLTDFNNMRPGKYIIRLNQNNKPLTISLVKEGI